MNMERPSNSTIGYNGGELHEQWHNRGCTEKEDPMEIDSTDIDVSPASLMPNTRKSVQNLPARCYFEPTSHHHNRNTQVDELLDDQVQRMSCSSVNTQDLQSLCKKLQQKKVTFSERSSLYIYDHDPLYGRYKSYTKAERENFGSEVLSEAIRIKRLVLTSPGASTKDSFNYLLKNNIISLEEIVGLEHLVLSKSTSKLSKERKDHAKAVLMEQGRQLVKNMQDGRTEKLGEFSASSSFKAAKLARIRAAMAA
mmetsp:Transcript_14252/g.25050  ORF Transcript_14252/g.25050 Transcript_14252/m.25050 type:complete len:253 (-) Transcript_14252:56-814(-)